MKKYLPRYLDKELEFALNSIGAVLIVGPKWCGKTTTAKQHSKSIIQLQDPRYSDSYIKIANTEPLTLLEGETPRLIDEWQMAPKLWDAVRYSVDEKDGKGLYILTGSTVVDDSKIMHSGTGRIHRLTMRPMSLYESGDSNGKISLLELFENPNLNINLIKSNLTIKDIIYLACRGGWPESLSLETEKEQLFIAKSYIKNICEIDTSRIDNVKRDPGKVNALLRSYARNISTLAKNTTIFNDINKQYEITEPTFYSYLNVLKRLFVIEDVLPWSPNIRSSQTIKKTPKKEFIDPSIAVAALNLNPKILLYDLNTFGFIFETLCIRDLKVYSSLKEGKVQYYNDKNGLEVDCVLTLNNGKYALIEFKLGSNEEEKAAKNLLRLDKLIKEKIALGDVNIPEPSFLAIITAGSMAYTREDGIKVIPIGCLS
ncbi:ATP-binding protein [Methanobrevibacter olleyae]|uniref:ATPase n=1 Tax=Methanobrevibacter olleyae TaxID=294671 RepID=A0A126QZK8_METOL|nr:DUF4143 domain-containing protein [Methanobrevibacter olleyae]AMK15246.1 ATPase [Methanobrevibacter olleyae]